jgi:hypothetical protein
MATTANRGDLDLATPSPRLVIVNAPLSGTAASVQVSGDQAFKFLAGNSAPTNSSIVLTATPKGALETLTPSYQWKYYKTSAPTGWTNLPVPSTSNTYSLGYDWASLNNEEFLSVQCEVSVTISSTTFKYTDDITIAKVRDGTAGTNARSVDLTASTQVITYSADGTTPVPSTAITLTATPRNAVSPTYSFNGSTASSTATFSYTPPTTYSASYTVTVIMYESAVEVARDVLTIYSVKPGVQGTAAVTGFLDNEAMTVPTDSSGNNGVYTSAGGTFYVYDGITNKTGNGVTYSVDSFTTGLTIAINSTTGVYSITGLTVDSANAVLKAVYGTVTILKTYSISKAKAGAPGTNARSVDLTASTQVITYSADGTTPVPSTAITLTATPRNAVSPTYSFNGSTASSTATFSYTPPTTYSASYTVTVIMYESAVEVARDVLTIYSVKPGVQGTAAVTGFLDNEAMTVPTDSSGNNGVYTSAGGTFYVYDGITNKTGNGVTYSVDSFTTGLTIAINSTTGVYSITGLTVDSANAVLKAVYGTVTILKTYSISKAKAGAPGTNARSVDLTASTQVITYSADGTTPVPSTAITLTATPRNAVSPTYSFNGSTASSTATFSYTPPTTYSASYTVTVIMYESAVEVARDVLTIYSVKPGVQGTAAVTGFLDNEAMTVPTDSSGNNGVYTSAGGTFYVYDGITNKTGNGVTYSVDSFTTGLTIAINSTTGVYSITGLTVDSANAVLKAVYGTVTILKTYSISKAKAGAPGTNARSVDLTASTQVITYSADGTTPVPSTAITLTATPRNAVSPTYSFNGSTASSTATFSYTPPTTYSASYTVTVIMYESAVEVARDVLTIYSVKPGVQGTAGAAAITVVMPNDSHVLPTTTAGVVTYTGSGTTIQVYEGNTLLNFVSTLANGSFTITSPPTVTSGTLTGIGTITGQGSGTTATVGDHSNLSTDSATITYTINIRRIGGAGDVTITRTQSLAKSNQGAKGDTGETGASAKLLSVFADSNIFTKNKSNAVSPNAITFTTSKQNLTGTVNWTTTPAVNLRTPSAGGSSDPNFSSVSLLLHGNGANGGTTFTDSSNSPVTFTNSGVTTSTTQFKFGTASLYFNGVTNRLVASSNVPAQFGTADFTVEFWIYPTAIAGNNRVISLGNFNEVGNFQIELQNSGGIVVHVNQAYSVYNASTISANTWTHVAVVRSSGTVTVYKNGTSIGSNSQPGNINGSYSLVIGNQTAFDAAFPGYIDDLRVTKGVARTITVPTAEYPDYTTGGTITTTGDSVQLLNSDLGTNTSVKVTATVTDGATYTDFETVALLTDGSDAITAELSNDAHTIPASNTGVVSAGSYTGSGTIIKVYEGSTALTYVSSLATSSFTIGTPVQTPSSSVTIGTITGLNTTTATVPDYNNLSTDVVTVSYPVTVRRANGTEVSLSLTQTLTKSRAGAPGTDGYAYWFTGATAVQRNAAGNTYTPAALNFKAYRSIGGAAPTDYSGRWVVDTSTNGTDYSTNTPTASDSNTYSYTPSGSTLKTLRVRFYASGGGTLLDEEIVPVVVDGAQGANAITIDLSNDSVSIPTASNGTSGVYTGATTTVKIYNGTTDDTANWTFSRTENNTTSAFGTGANINVLSVSDLTADTGSVTITAQRSTYPTQTAVFSLSKAKAGAPGTAAKTVSISSTSQVFAKSKAGVTTPTRIVLTAVKQNTAADATWSTSPSVNLSDSNGSSIGTTPTANTVYLYPASLGSNTSVTVTLTCDSITDTQTFALLNEGADGAAGLSALTPILSNSAHTVPADNAGAVLPGGYAGSGTNIRVFEGVGDLLYTSSVTPSAGEFTVTSPPTVSPSGAITPGSFSVSVSDPLQNSAFGLVGKFFKGGGRNTPTWADNYADTYWRNAAITGSYSTNNIGNIGTLPLDNSVNIEGSGRPGGLLSLNSIDYPTTGTVASNYGFIAIGYFKPPLSGTNNYYFELSSDDYSAVWIGEYAVGVNNRTLANAEVVANVQSDVSSLAIPLNGNNYYAIRIVMEEGYGADNFRFRWRTQSGSFSTDLSQNFKAPAAVNGTYNYAVLSGTDINYNSVSSLVHFETYGDWGSESSSFTNRTFTRGGGAYAAGVPATSPIGSLYALALNGSTDFISFNGPDPLYSGGSTTPWTVECWVYVTASSGGPIFTRQQGSGDSEDPSDSDCPIWIGLTNGFDVYTGGLYPTIAWYKSGTWYYGSISDQSPVTLNTWTHLAFVFTGSAFKMFKDGVDVSGNGFNNITPATTSYDLVSRLARQWYIGGASLGAGRFSGYIDEFRITKGVARYTQAFPGGRPSAPFPSDTTYKPTIALGQGAGGVDVSNHSAMSSSVDVATITYPITAKRANGTSTALSLVQTVTKSKAGATGASARSVDVTASSYVVNYNADNTTPAPSSITLTATPRNVTGTATYSFNGNTAASATTFPYSPATTYSAAPVTIPVILYENGTQVATDSITISSVKPGSTGAAAITVVMPNDSHVLPTTTAGVVTYTGSGTTIQVYEGNTLLNFVSTLANGSFTITSPPTVTSGTLTGIGTITGQGSGTTATVGDHSNLSTDSATITYTINVRRIGGAGDVTITRTQSLAKSNQGAKGDKGDTGDKARSVDVTASSYVVNYNADNTTPAPSSITLTATPRNVTGTATYSFNGNTAASATTFPYSPATTYSAAPVTIPVILYENGTQVATDSITISSVKPGSTGAAAITVVMPNDSHVLPTTTAGVVTYTGSGTTIQVYEGNTLLNFVSTLANGSFTITSPPTVTSGTLTGIGTITGQGSGTTATVGDHSNLSTDSATITYTINVRRIGGAGDVTITRTQSLAKSNQGAKGDKGDTGDKARSVDVTASSYVVNYNADNTTPAPSSITLTATPRNVTGTATYSFNGNAAASATTFPYSPATTYSAAPVTIPVILYENGTQVATDSITISSVKPGSTGAAAITVVMPNDSHVLPTTTAGVVTYTGSGTTIQVYEGNTLLNFVSTLANGSFTITSPPTVTSGTLTGIGTITGQGSGTTATVGDHSNLSTDSATITYTINVRRIGGAGDVTITRTQSLAKSNQGAKGDSGARGSTTGSVGGQTAWSDTAANDYFTNNSLNPKVLNDRITQYDGRTLTAGLFSITGLSNNTLGTTSNGMSIGIAGGSSTWASYQNLPSYLLGKLATVYINDTNGSNWTIPACRVYMLRATGWEPVSVTGWTLLETGKNYIPDGAPNDMNVYYKDFTAGTHTFDTYSAMYIFSATGFTETRYWNNSSWIPAAQVVDGNLIVTGTIVADKIAVNSITTEKITNAAITDAKIANLSANKITTGVLNASLITSGVLNADLMTAGTLSAQRINTTGLTVKDTEGNIILSTDIGIGSRNLAYNSSFFIPGIGATADGWYKSYTNVPGANTSNYSLAVNINGDYSLASIGEGLGAIWYTGSIASGYIFDVQQSSAGQIAVYPGQRLEVQALLNCHRCNGYVNVVFYNKNGDYVTDTFAASAGPGSASSVYSLANLTKVRGFLTVPAGSAYARLFIRGESIGQNDPYVFFARPFLAVASANQVSFGPWDKGTTNNNRYLDQYNIDSLTLNNAFSAVLGTETGAMGFGNYAYYNTVMKYDFTVSSSYSSKILPIYQANTNGFQYVNRVLVLDGYYYYNSATDAWEYTAGGVYLGQAANGQTYNDCAPIIGAVADVGPGSHFLTVTYTSGGTISRQVLSVFGARR